MYRTCIPFPDKFRFDSPETTCAPQGFLLHVYHIFFLENTYTFSTPCRKHGDFLNTNSSIHTLIKGTFILTIAGLVTRLIGFAYKIFLADVLGAYALGIYQLVFPVYSVCFTIYGAGIQTAVSQLVGAQNADDNVVFFRNGRRVLWMGVTIALALAFALWFGLYLNADFIANHLLSTPEAAPCLRILPVLFPFCAVSACIHGYYYGKKKASIPATSQFIEQIGRVTFVFLLAMYLGKKNISLTCVYAVAGLVVGEICAFAFSMLSLSVEKIFWLRKGRIASEKELDIPGARHSHPKSYRNKLLRMAAPLTGTKLVTSLLASAESILIPAMLRKYGMSAGDALSLYGILTGMSMSFILFPSTITNSLAVLLLPTVAEASVSGNGSRICKAVSTSVKYSLLIGLLATSLFMLFGNAFGNIFFHNKTAGEFMVILSWLCPFMYLSTTLGSIINGLGKTLLTFRNTVIGISLRILCICFFIPRTGISGYLFGLLVSQLLIALLDYLVLKKCLQAPFDSSKWVAIPALFLIISGFAIFQLYHFLVPLQLVPVYVLLFGCCILHCLAYIALLLISRIISPADFTGKK